MVLSTLFKRCDSIACFFGVMDACTVLYACGLSGYQLLAPHRPLYVADTSASYWSYLRHEPGLLALYGIGIAFVLSLPYSAWGLIRQRPSGYVVSYIQAPFRIVANLPSILPLLWVVQAVPRSFALVGLLVLESAKILWLESRRGRPPVVRESGPHSAVGS